MTLKTCTRQQWLPAQHPLPREVSWQCVAQQRFWVLAAVVFLTTAVMTVNGCLSMSSMAMPGGEPMSMTWMRLPGQSWMGAAANFVSMWLVMMVAMMSPSFLPVLWRYRLIVNTENSTRRDLLSVLVSLGYFLIWTALGLLIYPMGAVWASISMEHPSLSRLMPMASAAILIIVGASQFTAWKAHLLACCRHAPQSREAQPHADIAFLYGLSVGLRCVGCCAGLTVALLVFGVMDLPVMALVTVAISLERLMPATRTAARLVGTVAIGAGILMMAQAAGIV